MKTESLVQTLLALYVSLPLVYSLYIYIDNKVTKKVAPYPSLFLLLIMYIGAMVAGFVVLAFFTLGGVSGHGNAPVWVDPAVIVWIVIPLVFIKKVRNIQNFIKGKKELEERLKQNKFNAESL